MRIDLEFVVVNVGARVTHGNPSSTERFDLLFVILPIRIFSTALILFVLLSHREGKSFLHLFVSASTIDVGSISLSFHLLLLIFLDSLVGEPHLVVVVSLEHVLIGLWIGAFH